MCSGLSSLPWSVLWKVALVRLCFSEGQAEEQLQGLPSVVLFPT